MPHATWQGALDTNTRSRYGRGMTFTTAHVARELDQTKTPVPNLGAWWKVDVGARRPGWVYVATSPPPSGDWVGAELNRLEPILGRALAGRMLGARGMPLENAPRRTSFGTAS